MHFTSTNRTSYPGSLPPSMIATPFIGATVPKPAQERMLKALTVKEVVQVRLFLPNTLL